MIAAVVNPFSLLVVVFFGASGVCAQFEANLRQESYSYVVYYEDEACGGETAGLIGLVSGEDEVIQGANHESGFCSYETSCMIDRFSSTCKDLELLGLGAATTNIGRNGRIFQCDSSNSRNETCRFIEGCQTSSIFPHCNFRMETSSTLFKNPDLIRNSNALENPGLDLHSYMLMYSDNECTNMEAIHGINAGVTEMALTDETFTCEDAVACLFNANATACTSNGGALGYETLVTAPSADAALVCDATGEICVAKDASACIQSPYHKSCYYRHASAKQFLSNPEEYVKRVEPLGFVKEPNDTKETADGSAADPVDNNIEPNMISAGFFTSLIAPVLISIPSLIMLATNAAM